MQEENMQTVKVFKSGNSQAIRIPKDFLIDEKELYIQKIGKSIILTSKDDLWRAFEESLDRFSDDVFENGREQPEQQERDLF